MLLTGVAVGAVALAFLRPILVAFGGRGQTLEYAVEYTRIMAIGTPLAMLSSGASQLVSSILILLYLRKFRSVELHAADYRLKKSSVFRIVKIGIASARCSLPARSSASC